MKTRRINLLKRIALKAECEAIREAINKHGSRTAAAAVLGITTETIRAKLAAGSVRVGKEK